MADFAFDDVAEVPPRFGRSSKLTILDGTVIVKTIHGYDDSETPSFGLRMSFQVEKKITSIGDKAKIRIWNLNPESRGLLAQRSIITKPRDPLAYMRLEAGYTGFNSNNVGIIFNGTIYKAVNKRQGPDWITENEGNAVFGQALLNILDKSFTNTSTTKIVTELVQAAGWQALTFTPAAKTILLDKTEPTFVASGSAYEEARSLLLGYGLELNVDVDGATVFSTTDPRGAPSLMINENTGLVGTPQSTDLGANFRSLLDPRIRPGQLVRIDSDTLRESVTDLGSLGRDFMAREVVHSGDTHTDDWFTDVTGWFSPLPFSFLTGEPVAGPSIVDSKPEEI